MADRVTRALALGALTAALLALVLSGYTLWALQRSEETMREIAASLRESAFRAPVLPMHPPPPELAPED